MTHTSLSSAITELKFSKTDSSDSALFWRSCISSKVIKLQEDFVIVSANDEKSPEASGLGEIFKKPLPKEEKMSKGAIVVSNK